MSRTARFFNGVVLGYSNQALVMVVGLWLAPFLLRQLGQHDYGLWLTALQIMSYLALADFGIVALLPRTIAYATGRAGGAVNATDLPHILGQTALVVLAQTPLVAIAAGIAWWSLPHEWLALRGPLGMILGAFVVFFPLRILPAVLEGLQEQAVVQWTTILSWSVGTATNILLILSGFGLYSLVVGWLLTQGGSAVACAYCIWRRHPGVLPSRLPKLSRVDLFSQLGKGFWISVTQIGQVLMAGTDIVIISKVLGPAMVVPYACTAKLISVLSNQPQMLMHLAAPGLSEMKTSTSKVRLPQVTFALSQGLLLFSGLLVCVILAMNEAFVRWWVGANQFAGFPLTCLLLTTMVLRHWNTTYTYTIFCFGYERRIAISVLLDGIVTTSLMVFLVSRIGYIGVLIGSITGVCLVTLPVNLITVSRELGLPLLRLLAPLWPWFWRFAILAGACGVLAKNWVAQSPIQMIGIGVVVTLVYIAILFRPIQQSPLEPYLRRAIETVQEVFVRGFARVFVAAPRAEKVD